MRIKMHNIYMTNSNSGVTYISNISANIKYLPFQE